jgi:hypothetical protein
VTSTGIENFVKIWQTDKYSGQQKKQISICWCLAVALHLIFMKDSFLLFGIIFVLNTHKTDIR